MRTLTTIILTGLIGWAAPLQDAVDVCYDCHRKDGTHRKDLRECRQCGWMGGSCCTNLCCDTSVFTCKTCGRKSPANWPEGGKAVDGIQISIKPVAKTFKVGEPVELVVKVTNIGDKAWSQTNHAYSHGGFDVHAFWTAQVGGRSISNRDDVTYVCPQEMSHTGRTAALALAAGASVVFKEKLSDVSKEADEITIRVTEFVLGAESNELKVKISK